MSMSMEAPFFHELKRQASSYLNDKIRSARLALTDVTPTQLMTEEATSGDPSPPNAKTMSYIARTAFEIDEYCRIVEVLHKRFSKFDRKHWREPYKALLLLEHLLTHGPQSVAVEFQKDREVIEQMGNFQHIDEKGFNWGLTLKKKSERVLKLLERGPLLDEERERARKITHEIKGFGSFNLSWSSAEADRADRASECYGRSNSHYEDHWRQEDHDKENLIPRPAESGNGSMREQMGDDAKERKLEIEDHPFHSFEQQHRESMLLLSQ